MMTPEEEISALKARLDAQEKYLSDTREATAYLFRAINDVTALGMAMDSVNHALITKSDDVEKLLDLAEKHGEELNRDIQKAKELIWGENGDE